MSRPVRQIEPPPRLRRFSTLARVDYTDAFVVDAGPAASDRTAEQWARAILEDAPLVQRRSLRSGWTALGLRLGPTARSDRFVLGWEVRRNTPEYALLGAGSRFGLAAELLVKPETDALLFSTLVQIDNPIARAVWAGMTLPHQQVVRYVLERGYRCVHGMS